MRRPPLVLRRETLISLSKGKKVLHLGCTNHPYTQQAIENDMLLHFEIGKVASELTGFDNDDDGLNILRDHGVERLYKADLEQLESVGLQDRFELIIAGEMIEHLNNPGLFLNGIKRFMDEGSRLVITTINAYCALRFVLYALRGRGGVQEPVHPDHVAYYSYSTLKLLLERHGYSVEEMMFYDIGNEHRPHNPRKYNIINDIAVRFSSQLSDGLIAVCKLERT
ncbi:class I SAM-dependent methyltransferase [Leptolyngbya sp. 7M]|uniref:class I SAM-dependent methyltransferase n=1 Tax=Leptolyngbya sp. 7M TaxID=2812896 RepID=UPI001CECBB48|nr:methyltransferase domain-containing protein [Leptolyngbya sp. 7M]